MPPAGFELANPESERPHTPRLRPRGHCDQPDNTRNYKPDTIKKNSLKLWWLWE